MFIQFKRKAVGERLLNLPWMMTEVNLLKSPTLFYHLEGDWGLSDQKTMRSIYKVKEKEKKKETFQKS